MIVVTGTAKLTEEGWKKALPAMEAMIAASRQEEGCIEYAYGRDLLDPSIFRASEKFKDLAAFEAHFAAPHMATFRAALAEAKPTDLVIEVFEATKVTLPS